MNRALLDDILASPRIPSLPQVAVRVVEMTEHPDVSLRELAETIKHDQALDAKILRLVNSSYYGLSRPCTTLHQAMVVLGANAVKSLALSFSLVSAISKDKREGFDYPRYWRRGVHTAVGARVVAARVDGVEPEAVFLAGILQDVGMVAMLQALGDDYARAIEGTWNDHDAQLHVEQEAFGLDHAEVGAALLANWKFAEFLVGCVLCHERPDAEAAPCNEAVRCIALGTLASKLIEQDIAEEALAEFRRAASASFGFSEDESDACLGSILEESTDVAKLLSVDIGAPIDIEKILHRASERIVQITMAQQREASALNARNAVLERAVATDSLTGVANRGHFNGLVRDAYDRAVAENGSMSVVFIDADKFKEINDTMGHQAGDAVLVELAARLARVFEPAGGVVCRYGGEEFAVVLEGLGRADTARLAESVREMQAAEPVRIVPDGGGQSPIVATVSIGVASIEPQTAHAFNSVERLVRAADQAVYVAKGSGRNCVRIYNPRPRDLAA